MARKSSPRSAPLAVWSVCLSDPEQADVPPNALWVAIESRRLAASIQPRPQSRGAAAENQSVTASHRQSEAVRGDFLRRLYVGEPRHRDVGQSVKDRWGDSRAHDFSAGWH
jgi:hypothetical protein